MSEITISTGHPDAGRVYAEALDRVTAERDAALGRESKLLTNAEKGKSKYQKQLQRLRVAAVAAQHLQGTGVALQQRRTAADERADVLEGLLRRVVESSVLSFEQDAPEALESLEADICAALKGFQGPSRMNTSALAAAPRASRWRGHG